MQQAVQEDLRRAGYRVTPQREAVLRVFEELPEGTHLSAEDLHARMRAQDGGISLATTYRTVKLLASLGVLRELDFAEGHRHYELARDKEAPHHHLVCAACSEALEFEAPELVAVAQAAAEARGYRLLDAQFKVFGLCPACVAKGRGRR